MKIFELSHVRQLHEHGRCRHVRRRNTDFTETHINADTYDRMQTMRTVAHKFAKNAGGLAVADPKIVGPLKPYVGVEFPKRFGTSRSHDRRQSREVAF